MKKNYITLSLLLGVALSVSARERTVAEMKQAALGVIGQSVVGKKSAPLNAEALQVLDQKSQLTVLGTQGGGFAVIANDDNFSPVLGYSENPGNGEVAPGFLWWMNEMNASLEQTLANGGSNEPVKLDASYKTEVPQMLTSTWGQGAPYNSLTPVYPGDNGDEHYVVGCVATAMAQVMLYHKYPVHGEGSRSYRFAPGGGVAAVTLSANFGEATYDWDNMLDNYTGTYTDAQAQAAALISFHCGVSVKMTYTKDGSGSYSSDAVDALRKYFTYNPNIKFFNRDYFPRKEWMNIVYRELSDGCPILYGGQSTSGGHAFVLDGYNAQGLVRVNWGWNGAQDGYFDIGSLNGFSSQQTIVQVRLPDDTSFTQPYTSNWGLAGAIEASYSSSSGLVSITGNTAYQLDVDPFTGSICLVALNTETGSVTNLGAVVSGISKKKFGQALALGTAQFSASSLPQGKYRIYFASKVDGESTYQPVRAKETVRNSYILTIGDKVTLKADNDGNWTGIGSVAIADDTRTSADDTVRVYDTTGRLVYYAPASLYNEDDIPAKGVLIVKQGTQTKKILK